MESNNRKRKRNGRFACFRKSRRLSEDSPNENKSLNTAETRDENDIQSTKLSWREGRRIVELGVIVDQLKVGCSDCKEVLNLVNTVEETTQGLGSILYIQCASCGLVNSIKTGKTHRSPAKKNVGRPIWDINTKAATG